MGKMHCKWLLAVFLLLIIPTVFSLCSTNTDCAQNEICDNGTCKNVACFKNSDCGTDVIGNPYCSSGNVYHQTKNYICNNPGTIFATCTNSTNTELVQNCKVNETCDAGQCKSVVCSKNSDCGYDGYAGNPFCSDGNVFMQYKTNVCNNPGTLNSSCSSSLKDYLTQECTQSQLCDNGKCYGISCFKDSDCGVSGFTGSKSCKDGTYGDVFQQYIAKTCSNPGTLTAQCNSSTQPKVVQDCSQTQLCSNGSCQNVACFKNSDCGIDANVNGNFCKTGDLYKTLKTYVCNNAGTLNANCSNVLSDILQQNCYGLGCTNNACNAGCSAGWKCKDSSTKGYQSNNCAWSSLNVCAYGCGNGVCNSKPLCTKNSDCGAEGYTGSAFCKDGDIYKKYAAYTCQTPGATTGKCNSKIEDIKVIDCTGNAVCDPNTVQCKPIACSKNSDCGVTGLVGNTFCKYASIMQKYQTATCWNPGQANAYCTVPSTEKFLGIDGKPCSSYNCKKTFCTIKKCSADADCGQAKPLGGNTCIDGDVYQPYQGYVCNNAGFWDSTPPYDFSQLSYCTSASKPELVEDCEYGCSLGKCKDESELTDFDKLTNKQKGAYWDCIKNSCKGLIGKDGEIEDDMAWIACSKNCLANAKKV